jgi:hypothetical protein
MEKIYTLDEVAEALRMTRRGILKIAKRHGLCMVHGREVTFTESDVEGIKQAMRPAPAQPVPVSRHNPVRYALPSSRLRDRIIEKQRALQERKAADRIRNAGARQEGRELAAESKRQEAARKRAAKAAQAPSDPEPLDLTNRDPAYWTTARKRRLKAERSSPGEG